MGGPFALAQAAAPGAAPQPRVATGALTISSSHASLIFGALTSMSGKLTPPVAGAVVIEGRNADGTWSTLASTSTDAGGAYSKVVSPARTQELRARMADNSATSVPVVQTVTPRLTFRRIAAAPTFVGSTLIASVGPVGWRGKVRVSVIYAGRVRATSVGRPAADGKLRLAVPTDGVGRLGVRIELPASNGLSARTVESSVTATTRSLSQGARGADVRALLVHLRSLNYHVPGTSTSYGFAQSEVVLAFRKVHGLSRTYSVDKALWTRLALASPERPHFIDGKVHIEVNKARQYLSVVRGNEVVGTIHVSTGASGNTPLGSFHIYQKGNSHLYKFMAFSGNFGIHGYVPVPAFPASHGCVREPMWAAAWTYSFANIGTPVYVYR